MPPMTPQELDKIRQALSAFIREHTPPGSRLVIHNDSFLEVEVCCDGAVSYTALICCLSPGHTGDCYSHHKKVNFQREN